MARRDRDDEEDESGEAFSGEFERDILAKCARDPSYRRQASRVLDEHVFSDPAHAWVWRAMSRLGSSDRMTGALLKVTASKTIRDEDDRREMLRVAVAILRRDPAAPSAALRELEDFRAFHRMNAGMDAALKDLSRGDVKAARDKLSTAVRARDSLSYEVFDWWDDWDRRQERRQYLRDHPEERFRVATKISPTIDRYLDGGIGNELGLVVGTTGRGKSMVGSSLALFSAVQGWRTLFLLTENEYDLAATRLDARLYQVEYSALRNFELADDVLESIEAKRSRFQKYKMSGKLRIVSLPIRACTWPVVNQILDDEADHPDGPIRLVVFDTLDHLTPSERTTTRRDRETAAYMDGKSLIEERKVALWAMAHAPKEVVNKIATSENVGETYDKARLADIVISVNETKADQKKGVKRLYLAKNRQGKGGVMVEVRVTAATMTFEEIEGSAKGPHEDSSEGEDGDGEDADDAGE